MKPSTLRACAPDDPIDEMVRSTLQQVTRTYATLTTIVASIDEQHPLLMQLQANQRANEQMLSHFNHPAGSR
jgi:hypothetical protein